MPPGWKIEAPKKEDDYLERMTRAIFQAGLNWRMIENKWPNFQKAFARFSTEKVSRFGEREVKALMKDTGIVRNEGKIRSVIANAQESLRLREEFGSFGGYFKSFSGNDEQLIADLRRRFRYLGESSARIFLYMAGLKLSPTQEEMQWHSRRAGSKK